MIKLIELKNFKAFSKRTPISLAPITLLCGSNNSGKSSVIQALLLLKQSVEIPSDHYASPVLFSSGPYRPFGTFRDVVSSTTSKNFELRFVLKLEDEIPQKIALRYFKYSGAKKDRLDLYVEIRLTVTSGDDDSYFKVSKVQLGAATDESMSQVVGFRWSSQGQLRFFWPAQRTPLAARKAREFAGSFPAVFRHFFPRDIIQKKGSEYDSRPLPGILNGVRHAIIHFLTEHLNYLGPLRAEPFRYYYAQQELVSGLGTRGQHTWSMLVSKQKMVVVFYDPEKKSRVRLPLVKAVNYWLKYLGIADRVRIDPRKDGIYQIRVKGPFPGERTIADVGFGLSQVLPVLVLGLTAMGDAALVFEQPEIHLEPSAQAKLGDFFISLSKTGRQLIVESHSEHLVDRLRTRIVEKALDSKDLSLLFTEKMKSTAVVERIRFDQSGQIMRWPKGFFDLGITESKNRSAALRRRLFAN